MKELKEKDFDKTIKSKKLVVVDFFASWCMPCKMLRPILERVEEKVEGATFYSLDIDENEEIAKRYRVFSVPTVICFKAGEIVDSLVGLNPYDDVLDFVNRCNK